MSSSWQEKKRQQRLLGVRQLPHTRHPPDSSLPQEGAGRGTLLLCGALLAAGQDRAAKGRAPALAGGAGLSPGPGAPKGG